MDDEKSDHTPKAVYSTLTPLTRRLRYGPLCSKVRAHAEGGNDEPYDVCIVSAEREKLTLIERPSLHVHRFPLYPTPEFECAIIAPYDLVTFDRSNPDLPQAGKFLRMRDVSPAELIKFKTTFDSHTASPLRGG